MSIPNLVEENKILKKKLIECYDKKPVIYIGLVEENIYKFGYTNDIKTRLAKHKIQIKPDFNMEYIIETIYNREVEKDIKRNLTHKIISKIYNSKNQTELIELDDELSIHELYDLILSYKNSYNDKEIIIKLTTELEELHIKRNEKEEEIEEIEERIVRKEEEITKFKGVEFKCSVCGYISAKKDNVIRHINRKKVCGLGIREVIEIPIQITCEYCNKNFGTKQNLNIHIKKYCNKIEVDTSEE